MRPLRLEMSGFSAFAAPTVVDFTDVELCALVGPTGSGKSSVIDAMTFALYGAVARYDQRAVAPVINQLSTEAKVRFDFELSGTTYTAVRVVRRTKTGASTKEARLESGGDVLAGDERALSVAVTGLLGLDFDKFNKTVVLPQGRFAAFLHDKPSDRQELLRGLLGVGIYERIGRAARERAAQAKNAADVLDDQVARAGDVSDERLGELVARAEAIEAVLGVVESIGAEIDGLDASIATVEARLGVLATQRSVLGGVEVPVGVADVHAAVEAATAAAAQASATAAALRVRHDEAVAAAVAGPSELAMRLLITAHDARAAAQADADAADRRLADAVAAHEGAVVAATAAGARRAAAAGALVAAERARDDAGRALRDAGDLGEVRRLLGLHERRVAVVGDVQDAEQRAEEARAAADAAQQRAAAAAGAVADAERLVPAVALAQHLAVGEPCPVCRQTVATLPEPHGDAAAHLVAARAAERAAADELAVAEAARREADAERLSRQATLTALDEQLAADPDPAVLADLAGRLDALVVDAETARSAVEVARQVLADVDADPAVVAALVGEAAAAGELSAARALHGKALATLAEARAAVAGQPDHAAAEQALDVARRLAEARDDAHAAARQAADAARVADTELVTVRRREQRARHHYDEARERLSGVAAAADWAPDRLPARQEHLVEDWTALAGWAATGLAAVDARQAADGEERHRLMAKRAARLGELTAALATAPTPPADRPAARPVDVAAERRRLTTELAGASAAVIALEQERVRLAEARTEIARWRERAAVAGLLGNLLRTDAFERWLLDEALADLVERANVRLRELTAGQYTLVAADGVFRVVDHRNADEVRDARSLSGGETFLTSLALALALADSSVDASAQGGEPIESIFLDEGFGTLDPDTLDVVAGTIEELGSGGRMVGIVTHIRDLAERMPTRFEVATTPRTAVIERVDA